MRKLKGGIAGVLLSLVFAPGVLLAQVPIQPEPVPQTTQPGAPRELVRSFRDLGVADTTQLRGIDSNLWVNFGVRLDETVVKAKLKLRYAYSPALLPELSHLRIVMNGEVITTLVLAKEQAGNEVVKEIEIDPRYFTDFNHLEIHQIAHYTMDCEDAMHSSLWSSISSQSSLELSLQPLSLAPDLALLPAPFFDQRDNRRLNLPMSFTGAPTLEVLHAAGVVASWFGAQAGYRSARFPVLLDRLPQGHGVVFATNADHPAWLKLPAVQAPTLSVINHPQDASIKLLLIQGRNSADLKTAADALALGQVVLSGSSSTVTSVNYQPRRAAYDAPNWVRTDRVVKFGELVNSPQELQVIGHRPPAIRVNLRVPPDLLTWNRQGVPIDLRYRYTPPVEQDNSVLTIGINEQFVQSYRLRPSIHTADKGRLLLPLLENGLASEQDDLLIPSFQVGANNQLQFQFVTDYHKAGLCKDSESDVQRAAIDPDSTIDLRKFPHYTAMPNLALFANAGFPFTRYADLAETVLVLPDAPSSSDIEAALFLLGRMGRMTGVPALRFELAHAAQAAKIRNADLLVIGGPSGKDLLAQWNKSLPAVIEQSRRYITPQNPAQSFQHDLPNTPRNSPGAWKLDVNAAGPLGALLGFQSPVDEGRSVIAIAASGPEVVGSVLETLEDDGLVGKLRGDVAFVRGRDVSSFEVGDKYYVGHLPFWLALRFVLADYPALLVLLGILAGLLVALVVHWQLKSVAARRLAP